MHSSLIGRLVRVAGDVGVIEQALPPLRDLVYAKQLILV
jgi:hypothetical protein